MPARSSPLNCVVCLVGLLCLSAMMSPARAASWQEQRDAGFLAFSNADYAAAAGLLEKAVAAARDGQASPQEMGEMYQRLTTAYLATRWFGRAQATITQWDSVLEAAADEPWVVQQREDRDVLAVLVSEVTGDAPPEASSPPSPAPAPGEGTQERSAEAPASAPDADVPFAPDEPLATDEETPAGEAMTALAPLAIGYGIHLVSVKEQEAVDRAWSELKESYPDLLADKELKVRQVDLGEQGIFYRVYAIPFADGAAARAACAEFERSQQYCAVVPLE